MTLRNRHILLLIPFVIGAWSTPALAQDKEPDQKKEQLLKDLNAKGRTSYKNQDYKGAIAAFKQAYDIEQVPNLLYNIAKCYERLKDWDNAIKYYNEFIVSPNIKAETRKKTLTRIDEIRVIKKEEEDAKNKPKQDPIKPTGPDHTVSYVLMGTGGALLATGLVFGILANGQQSTFEESKDLQEKRDAQSSGKTYGYVADAGYGLGLVTAGIGLVLYLTAGEEAPNPAGKSSTDKAQSTWQPWVSRQGGGMQLQLQF